MADQLRTAPDFDAVAIAELLRRRGRVRGEPVAISLFVDEIPEPYDGAMVEPCAIVREAMDFGRHVYVDAEHQACLAGAWQAGFIDPPQEISSGEYLATHTDFFTPQGARAVKNGENVLPRGTVRAIGACPLDQVPEGVKIDVLVIVCDPSVAAMVGGVRVAVDGTAPRGAAGTSLCGDLFALPWHDPNVVISTGDVGGRMFNKIKPHEMFVIIPVQWAHLIPTVLGSRPDLTGLLDAIKPGYAAEREAKRAEREAAGQAVPWDDEARELLASAPDAIRDFAGPTMEEYTREHGHTRVTVAVIAEQMDSIGMRLEDVLALSEDERAAATEQSGADKGDPDHSDPENENESESEHMDTANEAEHADADDMGPGKVRSVTTRLVAAPPHHVWELLADPARWSDWYPDIRDVRLLGHLEIGGRLSFATGPVKVMASVSRLEAHRVLEFVGRAKGSTSTYRFSLIPHGMDSTKVTLRQVSDGVAARTMRPVLQRIADTSLPQWLHALEHEITKGHGK